MKSVLLKLVLPALMLLLSAPPATAQSEAAPADSLEVGFLTCAPGTAVYELYGHTAIRVKNLTTGQDLVFNYGVFDFDTPHFAWRFMMGHTDYFLGVQPFSRFAAAYARDGRAIEEQVLNLHPGEAARLVASLVRTATQEDWTYRYNFLYDNCTTRAVAEVEGCIDGRIDWPADLEDKTFRGIIHEFAATQAPWYRFGQDLILGAEIDAPIGRTGQMFSPVYAARYFNDAVIVAPDGSRRPLVARTAVAVAAQPAASAPFPLSPLAGMGLLLLLTLAVSLYDRRRGRVSHLFDDALMLLWGGAGCIVALLFFCSEHPAVGSNWLVLLLNPLPLLCLPVKAWRNARGRRDYYAPAVLVAVLVFLVAAVVAPQKFPLEIYVVALLLLVRSIVVLRLPQGRAARSASAPAERRL